MILDDRDVVSNRGNNLIGGFRSKIRINLADIAVFGIFTSAVCRFQSSNSNRGKQPVNFTAGSKYISIQKALVGRGHDLRHYMITRWVSQFEMLQSLKKAFSELNNLPQNSQNRSSLCLLETSFVGPSHLSP
ncbi:hypothetical protein HELRODRAFT_177677 [Helobdella robusta]|uniref:Uncharacterized protein n=1 Tax=Helobdella robusta TaxID=6412 RepID=T1FC23_HELRO|nr:hypothetical protein HELRODRAFT_177677 [Helobdella robusta]ESN98004.1 hypothetical protein HELRODRAFT_177677 [Helobdella robusta]